MLASPSQTYAIEDRSQVASTRRAATELAAVSGFSEEDAGRVALAVSEAATSILKHATRGRIVLRRLAGRSSAGIEVLALDRGPGLPNPALSARDGYSTTGTLGGGIGALKRLSSSFDLYSSPGQGCAFRMELWPTSRTSQTQTIQLGAVCVPKTGETVSGDDYYVDAGTDAVVAMVADGLGHGPDAARASRTAVQTLALNRDAAPSQMLAAGHRALASTRGAAVAMARVDRRANSGVYAGVGNIVGRICGPQAQHLVSHNGTLGHTAPRIQEFAFPFPPDALLIMHSDGIGTHWDIASYPGLQGRHPGLIAGVLYRDYDRGRDDATVIVIRNESAV